MDVKHFVTFLFQGEINVKEETREVHSTELGAIVIPSNAFGFKTFDKPTTNIFKDGKRIVSKNEVINEEIYYIGKLVSIDDIKREYGENSTAYKNMITNGYIGGVKTRDGFLAPISSGEKINIIAPEDVGVKCLYNPEEIEPENE